MIVQPKEIGAMREIKVMDLLDIDFNEATIEELSEASGLPDYAIQRVLNDLMEAQLVTRQRGIRGRNIIYTYRLAP